jgi:hypothetical protein
MQCDPSERQTTPALPKSSIQCTLDGVAANVNALMATTQIKRLVMVHVSFGNHYK